MISGTWPKRLKHFAGSINGQVCLREARNSLKTVIVCGARPNFIKIAPLLKAINAFNDACKSEVIKPFLVHTGQHYDYAMSAVFFKDLAIPEPDVHLGIGSGSHAEQTGRMLIELEKVLLGQSAELVIVVGDVNSTLAGALAAAKLNLPLAHVESGVRSFDMSMPEEVNRLLTDQVTRYLFTTCEQDDFNLINEGVSQERIYRAGNIMADTLLANLTRIRQRRVAEHLELSSGDYCLFTLHRPANVDDPHRLAGVVEQVCKLAKELSVVFPVHPRTQNMLEGCGLIRKLSAAGVRLTRPLGYIDFASLELHSRLVVTDSGGVQVETSILGVPCLTVMDRPVWTITHQMGTNHLLGTGINQLAREAIRLIHLTNKRENTLIPLWDGHTAERIVRVIGDFALSQRPGG